MTPKEKAKEFMQKAYDLDQHNKTAQSRCKQIAFLCVDEIIKATQREYINDSGTGLDIIPMQYWIDVKHELSLF